MTLRLGIGLLLATFVFWCPCPLLAMENDTGSNTEASAADSVASNDADWVDLYWEDRLRLESRGEAFKLEIGGRFLVDFGHIDSNPRLAESFGLNSGGDVEFREARLTTRAQVSDWLELVFQYELTDSEPRFKDVILRIKTIPYLGTLDMGHMKEPFSLEELISTGDITFMERGLPNAFVPGRNLGVMFHNSVLNDRTSWAVGFFHEIPDLDREYDRDNPFNLTARATGLPWYEEDGRRLAHVGIAYSHKFADPGVPVSFSAGPESSLTDVSFADTGDIPADGVDLLGLEAAMVLGPFSAQTEYVYTRVEAETDSNFHGFYIFGSYVLTGEHRGYDRNRGVFEDIQPAKTFNPVQGDWGALELKLRYSLLKLENGDAGEGETIHGGTVGLNWYLNKYLRFMAEYTRSDPDGANPSNIIQSRLQLAF